ncbi:AAA family ATPase [Bradyrhizobium elkanii]|uniref:AAA family ATPase n=1 Tax=Bradyrhizobium elkanii TaxID=29448 RepID=UPI003512CA3A
MSGDITEISRLLADRAASVAEYLLPRGRKDGAEWRVGSIDGEPGQSLGVHLTGHKAGIWAEFNDGTSGDLLDLWCEVKRVSLSEALDQAREWLGVTRPKAHNEPKKTYTRPPKPSCVVPQGRVRDYLIEERNIPNEVLARYKIGESGNDIIFPYILPDGVLALAKTRRAQDGADPIPTAKNCEPVLFGWQAVPENAREIVITEGEIDALSWAAFGFAAMSIPFGGGGGGKQNWIENEFERMDRFERIFISTDMDKPGDEAAEEIANRLGRHRCLRVKLPHKDANKCLVEGLSRAEMAKFLDGAIHLDPEGLRRASDFVDAVTALFWPAHDAKPGYKTPYGKLGEKLLFRPGELTLWTGSSGAGKSQILSDCMVDWVNQGSRICLSSLEMKPEQSLKRMCKQTVGVDRPTDRAIRDALQWLDRGLLLYERVGKSGVRGLLDIFSFARAKYGCDQFVIDSLMRLGIPADDYNAQEQAMFEMVDWTLKNNVHVHLVAHSRKGDKDRGVPETEDVKGAMEIGANAFNIVTVWRNRKLEDQVKAAKSDEERRQLEEKPGVIMNIAKQRNGDFEGKVGLWFDQASYQYQSSFDRSDWNRRYLTRGEAIAA